MGFFQEGFQPVLELDPVARHLILGPSQSAPEALLGIGHEAECQLVGHQPLHQTLGVHCDGGLRPRFILPANKMHPANGLTAEQCALVETLAIGCHAVNRGNPQPGEHVLVIGAGPIGLSAIEFAKLSGARTLVMDMNEQRLDFCRKVMGVRHTIKLSDNLEKDLRDLTDGHLPDVVIDATGHSGSMSSAFGLITHAGRLRCRGAGMNSPCAHFLRSRSEIGLKSQQRIASADDAIQSRFIEFQFG